jgi:hypothetical protein
MSTHLMPCIQSRAALIKRRTKKGRRDISAPLKKSLIRPTPAALAD